MKGLQRRWSRAVIPIAAIAAAFALSWMLDFAIGYSHFAVFLVAVAVSAWLGGMWWGVAATLISSIGIDYLLPPVKGLVFDRETSIDLAIFVLAGAALTVLTARLRRSLDVAQAVGEALRREQAAREQLWAAVAHDLRNPLAALGLRAELLRRELGRLEDSADLIRHVDEIKLTTKRMSSMVSETLDSARLAMGAGLLLDLNEVEVCGLVQSAVAEMQLEAPERRIATRFQHENIPAVWDADRIRRVLINLLSNALKYSEQTTEVAVQVVELEGQVQLTVEDHGIGIPAAELPNIFSYFYRASNVRDTHRGIGLGLAGSHEIVDQHGGSMSIESEQGVGTRVHVRLPKRVITSHAA